MEVLQNKWAMAVLGLVAGQVGGRLLAAFLGSASGRRFLEGVDGEHLTPLENRVVAQRWSAGLAGAMSGAAAALIATRREPPPDEHVIRTEAMSKRKVDWVQVIQRAGEIMLAMGAIFRVLGEFLEDRQHVANESQGRTARRLG